MIFQELYDTLKEVLEDKDHRTDLKQCTSSIHQLFESTLQECLFKWEEQYDEQLLLKANAIQDYCNEAILMYHFKDVPEYWRRMLMDAGLLKAFIQLNMLLSISSSSSPLQQEVQSIMRDLDICCIVSGSPGQDRRWISNLILDQLQQWLTTQRFKNAAPTEEESLPPPPPLSPPPEIQYPIERLSEAPSFEWFLNYCNQDVPTPIILSQGVIDTWPAFHQHPWSSMNYLLSIASDRMIPVEIGSQYTDTNWQQKMMSFSQFIHQYILLTNNNNNNNNAYLAQHDLFYQIPRLEEDILVPDYCYIEPTFTSWYTTRPTNHIIKNAWFGPKGTKSPLHQDPYHNLLCQVVGSKYIRLISPQQSQMVYPRLGLMTNTSQVDVEYPNYHEFPLFQQVNYLECILQKGEVLYLPPKWWHFVKSLETSFSVSLWF